MPEWTRKEKTIVDLKKEADKPRWVKPARKLPGGGVEISFLKAGVFVVRLGGIRDKGLFQKANEAIKSLPRHARKFDMENKYWAIQPEFATNINEIFEELNFKSERARQEFEKATGTKVEKVERVVRKTASVDYGKYTPKTVPMPHQDVCLEMALETNFRFLLGDEMGLGKTKQIIDLIGYRQINLGDNSFLILCPSPLKLNWREEFKVHGVFPEDCVFLLSGTPKERTEILKSFGKRQAKGEICVLIVNYELVLKDLSSLLAFKFDFIACDEAHRLKNKTSKTTKAVFEIANGLTIQAAARKRLVEVPKTRLVLATGTPVANSPSDLFSLFNLIDPNVFGSWTSFANQFCEMGGFNGREVVAFRNLPELRKKILPLMLRRLKEEVLEDLPPKSYQNVMVEMTPQQRKYYNAVRDRVRSELLGTSLAQFNPLNQLMVFRQICAGLKYVKEYTGDNHSAKMDVLMEIIEGTNQKVVIFDEFVGPVIDIAKALGKKAVMHHGDMTTEEKFRSVNEFQKGDAQVFSATIGSAALGLTLTAASHEVFHGRTWQPAANLQAEDRCHRIGQNDKVFIQNLILKDTVEERIIGELIRKQQDINNALGESRSLFSDANSILDLL